MTSRPDARTRQHVHGIRRVRLRGSRCGDRSPQSRPLNRLFSFPPVSLAVALAFDVTHPPVLAPVLPRPVGIIGERGDQRRTAPNGTAVRKSLMDRSLRLSQFRLEFCAGPLHERVAMAATFQDARLDPAGPVRHFVGGDLGQYHVV